MHKILVADDHAVVRKGLIEILKKSSDFVVKGEADSAEQVLEKIYHDTWDAVILDLSMPGKGGMEVLKQLRLLRPQLPVLILSVHPEDQYAQRVLKAGAAGYLTKDSAPEELLVALRKVCAGGKYVSPTLAEWLVESIGTDRDQPPHEILSDREYEVMRLMAEGLTLSEIANRLSLSIKTISTYRTRILEKLNMKTSAEIMRYAIEKGLVG
ncbi:MAG: response regulator transcription factor [Candidatus Hydrogenedentes bacterium]|nr:response regulator transcription factor [Candidatus Hydrogenedentota bacterium]